MTWCEGLFVRFANRLAFRLKASPLKDAADWLDHYRKFWEQSFDRLDNYLRELQTKGKKPRRNRLN